MTIRSGPLLLLLVAAAADEAVKDKKWQETLLWNDRAAGTPLHSCAHHLVRAGHQLGMMFGTDHLAGMYYELADGNNFSPVALIASESTLTSGIHDETCVVDMLKCMHEHGADLDEMVGGETAFSLAIGSTGSFGAIRYLAEHVDGCAFRKPNVGSSLVHLAVTRERVRAGDTVRILELLLSDLGCDADVRNDHGVSPLHIAADLGHAAAVALLVEHGADPRAEDKMGDTPAVKAAMAGHARLAVRLKELSAAARRNAPEEERAAAKSGEKRRGPGEQDITEDGRMGFWDDETGQLTSVEDASRKKAASGKCDAEALTKASVMYQRIRWSTQFPEAKRRRDIIDKVALIACGCARFREPGFSEGDAGDGGFALTGLMDEHQIGLLQAAALMGGDDRVVECIYHSVVQGKWDVKNWLVTEGGGSNRESMEMSIMGYAARGGSVATVRRLHELGAPYAVGCETDATKWYDPRTWLNLVTGPGDGAYCPLRVATEAGHADVVAFLAELLPDVDPATGKRQTKEL